MNLNLLSNFIVINNTVVYASACHIFIKSGAISFRVNFAGLLTWFPFIGITDREFLPVGRQVDSPESLDEGTIRTCSLSRTLILAMLEFEL